MTMVSRPWSENRPSVGAGRKQRSAEMCGDCANRLLAHPSQSLLPIISHSLLFSKCKHRKNCQCCPLSLLIEGSLWRLWLLFLIVRNLTSVSKAQISRITLSGCSLSVTVVIFLIAHCQYCHHCHHCHHCHQCLCLCHCLFVGRTCLIITLIKCLKGHKYLGWLFESVF